MLPEWISVGSPRDRKSCGAFSRVALPIFFSPSPSPPPLPIINPSLDFELQFSPFLSPLGRRSVASRLEDDRTTTEKETRRRRAWRGLRSRLYISMEPSWCEPRNYVGITRPGRRADSIGGSRRSRASRATLSHPRRRRQTQPLPLPPPHVAAPSPDKVNFIRATGPPPLLICLWQTITRRNACRDRDDKADPRFVSWIYVSARHFFECYSEHEPAIQRGNRWKNQNYPWKLCVFATSSWSVRLRAFRTRLFTIDLIRGRSESISSETANVPRNCADTAFYSF